MENKKKKEKENESGSRIRKSIIRSVISPLVSIFLVFCLCLLRNYFGEGRIPLEQREKNPMEDVGDREVCIFIQESCVHCHELKEFCKNIDMSHYNVKFYDIGDKRNFSHLLREVRKRKLSVMNLGTPMVFYGEKYMVGFDKEEHDEEKFLQLLRDSENEKGRAGRKFFKIPFFGIVSDDKVMTSPHRVMWIAFVDSLFSRYNLGILLLALFICLCFGLSRSSLLMKAYFLFLSVLRFLLVIKFLNVEIFATVIGYTLLFVGCYAFYRALGEIVGLTIYLPEEGRGMDDLIGGEDDIKDMSGDLDPAHRKKSRGEQDEYGKYEDYDYLRGFSVFLIAIVTFVAGVLPFLEVGGVGELALTLVDGESGGFFRNFFHSVILAGLLPLVDFLLCLSIYKVTTCLIGKVSNIDGVGIADGIGDAVIGGNIKKGLTIIKILLFSGIGIFVIFI